jgi:2-polyprenyl-6-methoxyphenol hydroxylase-like FAD-dependent oxidoreductase
VSLDGTPSVTSSAGGVRTTDRARLVVGADGRSSVVRRQLGIPLEKDPPHHLFAGLLVDGADGWPEDLQTAGASGDVHFLAFPQGAGRVRLYLGFPLEQRRRLAGSAGPAEFLKSFHLDCVPHAEALAGATPIGPCATYANEDAWVDVPVADGAVLLGDAAGWNDPITGQGLAITLRDVRIVSELLASTEDWSPATFAPYVEERRERLRRLRYSASVLSTLLCEFGPEARERRIRAHARMAADPMLSMPMAAVMVGPEVPGPEFFTPEHRARIFDPD